MLPSRDFGVCRVKVGLLILRDCKEPAVAECCRCGRGVCGLHQVIRPEFTYCPECAAGLEQTEQDRIAQDPSGRDQRGPDQTRPEPTGPEPTGPEPGGREPAVERVYQRRRYYQDYDYRPYYFGHHYYFSDSDFHTFGEQRHVVHHERPESAQPANDNLDDAMES